MYKNACIEGFDFMDNAKDSMNEMKGKIKKKVNPEKDNGFFSKVAEGGSNVGASFLGPTHNYAKEILAPQEMGMRPKGSMDAFAKNVSGIIAYTDVLVSGDSKAQQNSESGRPCDPKTGKNCSPLGNSFFLETGGKCKDSKGKLHKRWMYINNKPTGSIPFISDMTGKNTPGLRGLIPGAIENLGHINPLAMFSGFLQGTNPKCSLLKLKTTTGQKPKYVANADIADLDPCLWDSKGNPRKKGSRDNSGYNKIGNKRKTAGCSTKAGFMNMNKQMLNSKKQPLYQYELTTKDPIAKVYNAVFGGLLIYLMYKGMVKSGQLS